MGIAAYRRGNAVISRGICQTYGCPGCSSCREPAPPTPRPPGWGSKARAKALRRATGLLRYMLDHGHEITVEELADMVRQDTKIGRKTARDAARIAWDDLFLDGS